MADWRVSGDELIRNEELIDGIAECWLDGGMLTMRETNCAEEAEGGGGQTGLADCPKTAASAAGMSSSATLCIAFGVSPK